MLEECYFIPRIAFDISCRLAYHTNSGGTAIRPHSLWNNGGKANTE